jgi:hypothetical protein
MFFYILADLGDMQEIWYCDSCYWRYYHARPIIETLSEKKFSERFPGELLKRCGECGV